MDNVAAPTRLLGVWAHPDDEAYLSAGLMLRAGRAGAHVTCWAATAGERGTDDPVAFPPERLAVIRAGELRRALAEVGVDDVRIHGLADGGLPELGDDAGEELVAAVLDDVRPDLVVTFGPDGMTGHPDHVAVSRWTTRAWHRRRRAGRLVYAATTPAFAARFRAVHEALGVFPPGHPVVSQPDEIALEVRLDDEELDRKRASLAAHASQTGGIAAAMGEHVYRHWWDVESFRPPRTAELLALGTGSESPRRRAWAARRGRPSADVPVAGRAAS